MQFKNREKKWRNGRTNDQEKKRKEENKKTY